MSKIPGKYEQKQLPSNAPAKKTTGEKRADFARQGPKKFDPPSKAQIKIKDGAVALAPLPQVETKKVEKAAWTAKLERMVDKFVGLLADAKANLQAIVRAAKELCRATKGLDPSLNVLVANKVETLSLQEQANVFGNVEKIENNYLSLDGNSATFDLLMNTKMVVEQALTTSAPVSVSLGVDPATFDLFMNTKMVVGQTPTTSAPVSVSLDESEGKKFQPELKRKPAFGPGGTWDRKGEEATKAFVDCLLHGKPSEMQNVYYGESGLHKVVREKSDIYGRTSLEYLVGGEFDRWIGAALAGKSQDQIAQIRAKVATAEKAGIKGEIWNAFKERMEVVLLASKPKEDERLQLSEAFLKSLASGGDIHATGPKMVQYHRDAESLAGGQSEERVKKITETFLMVALHNVGPGEKSTLRTNLVAYIARKDNPPDFPVSVQILAKLLDVKIKTSKGNSTRAAPLQTAPMFESTAPVPGQTAEQLTEVFLRSVSYFGVIGDILATGKSLDRQCFTDVSEWSNSLNRVQARITGLLEKSLAKLSVSDRAVMWANLAPHIATLGEEPHSVRILAELLGGEVGIGKAELTKTAPSQEERAAKRFVTKLMIADPTWHQAGEFTGPVLIKVLEGLSDGLLQELVDTCETRLADQPENKKLAMVRDEAQLLQLQKEYLL